MLYILYKTMYAVKMFAGKFSSLNGLWQQFDPSEYKQHT